MLRLTFPKQIERLKSFICIVLCLLFFCFNGAAQMVSALNMDFSQKGINTKLPQEWWTNGSLYDFIPDTVADSKEGHSSISIQSIQATTLTEGDISMYVMAYPFTGHKITFSGYIKTDSVINGYATLYLYTFASDTLTKKMVNYDGRVSGTQNRTKVSVSLDINSDCDYIVIGGELRGSGKASFDGFTLECDGKPLIETEAYSNNPKMIDWLNKYKKPLPDYISDTLYKSLNLNFLNGYKYIALGENTHGSSEEFIAKGEMIKSLILHNGVRVIAFELGLAEGDIVDKCLQNNCLGISEAWRKVSSFPWDNTEVLNFLKWVADYNSKVSVNDRVHFVGMDIQTESLATNRLKNYATATSNKKLLYKLESLSKLQKSSYIYMYGNGFRWLKKSAAKKFIRAGKVVLHQTEGITDSTWVSQYGLMLYQCAVYYSSRDIRNASNYRDNCMASTLVNESKMFNSGKVVIWAHNAHIANKSEAMGSYLKTRFRDSIAIVGFGSDEGSYNTTIYSVKEKSIKTQAVKFTPSNLQCYEYILSKSHTPNFILPLNRTEINDSTNWLYQAKLFRETTLVSDTQFRPYNLGKAFDYLVFIRHTNPSHDYLVH